MGGIEIVTIRDGVQFTPDAAAAFRRAEAQVQDEFGRGIDVNSTYRDWNKQLGMFNAWSAYVNGTGPYPGHSKALHPDDPLAFHTKGTAVDSDDWTNTRIVQILAENGFIRNRLYVPNENHHFEYIRSEDKNYGKPTAPKEITVKHYQVRDADTRKGGRTLVPGGAFYLNKKSGQATGAASSVVGGIGPYSITPHIYAEGTPGDVVLLRLSWQDVKTSPRPKNSYHYEERLTVDRDGLIRASREFKRAVNAGFAVYVRLDAPKSNKGPVKVTLLDCDSYLFKVA